VRARRRSFCADASVEDSHQTGWLARVDDLERAANSYNSAPTRRVSRRRACTTSGQVVTEFQSDSSRTDWPRGLIRKHACNRRHRGGRRSPNHVSHTEPARVEVHGVISSEPRNRHFKFEVDTHFWKVCSRREVGVCRWGWHFGATALDRWVARTVARHTSPAVERPARLLTWAADEHVLCVIAGGLWLAARPGSECERRYTDHLALSVVTTTILRLIDQQRPDRCIVHGPRHGIPRSGKPYDAFPSGHAMHVGAVASAVSWAYCPTASRASSGRTCSRRASPCCRSGLGLRSSALPGRCNREPCHGKMVHRAVTNSAGPDERDPMVDKLPRPSSRDA
jgi:hypothetical protein